VAGLPRRDDAKPEQSHVSHFWLVGWLGARRSPIRRPEHASPRAERYNAASDVDEMTEEIKKKLRDELNLLEHELAFDIPRELKKAVALGDLSENAEYHTAKQRQEYLKARVRQLGQRLADLSLVNMNNIPKDKVGLGSTVTIFDGTKNEEMRYELVASEQSDVAAGKISTTSPIGRALLNKKVGDTATVVTPGGSREMEILKLSTMHDLAEAKSEADAERKSK
jgi:transcription elongation factor GreA